MVKDFKSTYEKIDKETVKVITTISQIDTITENINLKDLLQNKLKILQAIKDTQDQAVRSVGLLNIQLNHIDDQIKEFEKLGITGEEK